MYGDIKPIALHVICPVLPRSQAAAVPLPPLVLLPLRRVRQVLAEREAGQRHGVQPHQGPLREQRPRRPRGPRGLPEDQRRRRHSVME